MSRREDQNVRRQELLDVVGQIKSTVQSKLGNIDFPTPQFIIVGKQSAGKSRLVEALAGETFNFVCGTLGSRRPTRLEFRMVPDAKTSRWSMLDKKTRRWDQMKVDEIMVKLGQAHESLGSTVSSEEVCVRVESDRCCDMQIVDLPGFREFALDDKKQRLAEQIDSLVTGFMQDKNNFMLCVEEAGDAANLSTLTRCKKLDPRFQRTLLVRTKLDKYYRDLTPENVNEWLRGFGDLPESLLVFAMTLPNWKEGTTPELPFEEMRTQFEKKDIEELTARGASPDRMKTIGFTVFQYSISDQLEKMFTSSIGDVVEKLEDMTRTNDIKMRETEAQMQKLNVTTLLNTVRQAALDFGDCLSHIMDGQLHLDVNCMNLEMELEEFQKYHEALNLDCTLLPSDDFGTLEDYLDVLRNDVQVPSMEVDINGGAQFRRLMFEVECFCRFSELSTETRKKDVVQAHGVRVGSTTWREVVVKLLNNEAHLPMRDRVSYVGYRLRWFFCQQKEVILEFMRRLKSSTDARHFSAMYPQTVDLLDNNEMIKQLVFDAYDKAVADRAKKFIDLFHITLASIFSNPWVFLKHGSAKIDESDFGDVTIPSFEDTKARIPKELDNRLGIDNILNRWIAEIPDEPSLVDEAVDRAQTLCIKTFTFIRAQISDHIELFAESFFKTKLLRHISDDMRAIQLAPSQEDAQQVKYDELAEDLKEAKMSREVVELCTSRMNEFIAKRKREERSF